MKPFVMFVSQYVHLLISLEELRPQLAESLVNVIRAHLVKVYNNYASALIIYKVNRHFSFLSITFYTYYILLITVTFDKKNMT